MECLQWSDVLKRIRTFQKAFHDLNQAILALDEIGIHPEISRIFDPQSRRPVGDKDWELFQVNPSALKAKLPADILYTLDILEGEE